MSRGGGASKVGAALVLCLLAWLVRSLAGEPAADDTLSLVLSKQGSIVTARAVLESRVAGVQGLSFAVCSSPSDAVVLGAEPGEALLSGNEGGPADFVAIRSGDEPGSQSITVAAVIDLDAGRVLGEGSHEVLVARYRSQAQTPGVSLRFCEAGSPPVKNLVVRGSRTVPPETRVISTSGNILRIQAHAEGTSGSICAGIVPLYVSTDRPGLTGLTIAICAPIQACPFAGVPAFAAPELAPYEPVVSTADVISCDCQNFCFPQGVQVSLRLGKPLPQVTDFPVLSVNFWLQSPPGASLPIGECTGARLCVDYGRFWGDVSPAIFAFGDEGVLPRVIPGSLDAVHYTSTRYSIPDRRAGDVDPLTVAVQLEPDNSTFLESYGGFDFVVRFDPELFEVVREATPASHRGPLLAATPPPFEEARYEDGGFLYSALYACGAPDVAATTPDFVKLRLRRKTLDLPGDASAPLHGGPYPLRLESFVTPLGQTLSNGFYMADQLGCTTQGPYSPRVEDGSVTIGNETGFELHASSATVQPYQPAEISIAIDSTPAAGGIALLRYSVLHDPGVVAVVGARASEALLALNPRSSDFEFTADRTTHSVVLGPSAAIEDVRGFALATISYRPIAPAGRWSALGFGSDGSTWPRAGSILDDRLQARVAVTNDAGRISVEEDPSLLAYSVGSSRAPPGSVAVVSVELDSTAGGVPGLRGSICHDPTLASVDPAYLGASSLHLGAALAGIRDGLPPADHALDPRADGAGVVFRATVDEGDLRDHGLGPGKGQEVFRVGYLLGGRYGDELSLDFCADAGVQPPAATNAVVAGEQTVVVQRLTSGRILLTDRLAAAIAPEAAPGELLGVAVTEFGWTWGFAAESPSLLRHGPDGAALGGEIALPATPRRVASGGEGWAWVSLPGQVAIVRPDGVERTVGVGGEPYGIAVARDRTAWVAVSGSPTRLVRVSRDGRILRDVNVAGADGAGPGELAIDEEGGVWFALGGLDRIGRMAPDGAVVSSRAARLRSSRPAGLAADLRGSIWASDAGDRALLRFDLGGRELERLPLPAEPTDLSIDGEGAIWTVLRTADGDRLARVVAGGDGPEVSFVKASSTFHGDRTGLASVGNLLGGEDSDGDSLTNLLEIQSGTNPLDGEDPPPEARVPPVRNVRVRVLSIRVPAGAGDGGGAQDAAENSAGVSWEVDEGSDARQVVRVNDEVVATDLPGDQTSLEVVGLPPGLSQVSVTAERDGASSPQAVAEVQFGPGTTVESRWLTGIRPGGLAVDATGQRLFVLDASTSSVLVLDAACRETLRFRVPGPLGDPGAELTGIAYLGTAGAAESLLVLDGATGSLQEVSVTGGAIGGPVPVLPVASEGTFFDHLAAGPYLGEPTAVTIAHGPQNDDIIIFRFRTGSPAERIPYPLTGSSEDRFTVGGIVYNPAGGSVLVATGLAGEVLPGVIVEVPLGGGRTQGKVALESFARPEGLPYVRGIGLAASRGSLYALTSDGGVHILSDFGISRGAEDAPEILGVRTVLEGGGGAAYREETGGFGPVGGTAEVIIEGRNFGLEAGDLRVFFGKAPGSLVSLERAGRIDRLRVVAPPGERPGVVPVFLFRTRALDILDAGFSYCDPEAAAAPDCDLDGIPDSCELPVSDCNRNGVLDACDISGGFSRDVDADGLPDECSWKVAFDRADPSGDGSSDISDALYVLGYLFLGTPSSLSCVAAADTSADGSVDIGDPILLLGYMFLGTAAPPPPFGSCGFEAADESAGCDSHPPCGP